MAMCGIAGCLHRAESAVNPAVITAMTTAIAHRGPDGSGQCAVASSDGAWRGFLGHRRLAIIDLAGGVQPMEDVNQRAALVFNGEIYNFREIRRDLEAEGCQFKTNSDTEVLLAAYLAWGSGCVGRLRGMFAFAVWDRVRDRLFLARDRFGKKPLYLWEDGKGGLAFASEIKALLAHPMVPAQLDRASVLDYLTWRYVPGPHTLFAGIRKLPPAHWALWEKGRLTEVSYWAPPDAGELPSDSALTDPVGTFTNVLDDCVAVRMVSDVPFGAFLSGGIDSSSVVALMSRHSSLPINTFSVGYAEAHYSELRYASVVAKHFGTNHHELVIKAEDVISDLPDLTYFRDAPVAEPADVPISRLSREAARTVKMVLTGEGSDEVLGGYPKHRGEKWVVLYQRLVPPVVHRRMVMPLIESLPYDFRRTKTVAACIGLADPHMRLPRWFGAFSPAEIGKLYALDAPLRDMDPAPFAVARGQSPLRRILVFDQASWLPDNLLERGDRMTMAASIEARMPFMDETLALLLARLPDSWRVSGFTGKRVLRRAMADILPREVLARPKVGFRVPVEEWFRGRLRGWVDDLLLGPQSLTRDWYHRERLRRLVESHAAGRQNHEKALWMLVTLELFQRRYRLE
jgi:asparagine synthase (glutamine-hydrolysing)